MFSGFWGWFLVVVIVAVIFGAGKLPELRKEAEEKLKLGMAVLEKSKEELNKKIAEKAQKTKVSPKKETKEEVPTDEPPAAGEQ